MNELRKVSLPNEPLLTEIGQMIAAGYRVTLRVRGNSMNPFFVDRRDEVILSPFTKYDLRPGAIVLVRDDSGKFVLHRIIEVEGDKLTLMGDGNLKGTEEASAENVIGLVTNAIRKGKQITCSGFYWDTLSSMWVTFKPVRRWLLAIWRRV